MQAEPCCPWRSTATERPPGRYATSPIARTSPSPTLSRSCWPSRVPELCVLSVAWAADTFCPVNLRRSCCPRLSRQWTGRLSRVTSPILTPMEHATMKASVFFSRSGQVQAPTCVSTWIHSHLTTLPAWPKARSPGLSPEPPANRSAVRLSKPLEQVIQVCRKG